MPATADAFEWTGVTTRRVEHATATVIFCQGDPATSVMFVEHGNVRLSVLSHTGKEAVIAVLEPGTFFGEGCLAGQSRRMATATAMLPTTIIIVDKEEMKRQLQARPAFSSRFLAHMVGTTRSRVNFYMNKFRKLGFIEYNGGLKIHSSLLSVVLHD